MVWLCPECEFENEDNVASCEACECARPEEVASSDAADADPFSNFKVGAILSCEEVAGTKLKKLRVDVSGGGEDEAIDVVTNAPNVKEGIRVVIACAGAVVDGVKIKRTQVSGIPSNGVVCDSVMLGWTGGGAGTAALIPDQFEIGSKPPAQRPRGDAKK